MVHMGIPEGREWFFGDSAMAIDRAANRRTERMKSEAMGWRLGEHNGRKAKRWSGDWANTTGEWLRDGAATGRQQRANSRAMERRRGDENGREAIGEEKGECRFWI